MKVERLRRANELLKAALERETSVRGQFLDQVCEGDEELRGEVESLLAAHSRAGRVIEHSPAEDITWLFDTDSQVIIDQSLGRYKILSLLGTGGMGQVYRALDTTLGREAAVKVLPYRARSHHRRSSNRV